MSIRRVLIVPLLVGASFAVTPSMAAAAAPPAANHPAPQGQFHAEGRGNGTFHGSYPIRGAADKVKSELASGQMSEQEADGIAVSVSYVVTAKGFGQGQAGDPTVTASFYENNPIGMRLWTFKVTQSFHYYNYSITWLSALSWSGTSVSYIWWNISNESSSTSSPPTGVWYTQTYANAVYQYCAYWVMCVETSYAEAWLNYWGDGYWSWNGDYYNSF